MRVGWCMMGSSYGAGAGAFITDSPHEKTESCVTDCKVRIKPSSASIARGFCRLGECAAVDLHCVVAAMAICPWVEMRSMSAGSVCLNHDTLRIRIAFSACILASCVHGEARGRWAAAAAAAAAAVCGAMSGSGSGEGGTEEGDEAVSANCSSSCRRIFSPRSDESGSVEAAPGRGAPPLSIHSHTGRLNSGPSLQSQSPSMH
jgi:hypothetical protein